MKLTLGLIGALVVTSTAFYMYYHVSSNTIRTLRDNTIKLEQAVSIQTQTIKDLEEMFQLQHA